MRSRLLGLLLLATSCTFDTAGIALSADQSQAIDLRGHPLTDASHADQALVLLDLMHDRDSSDATATADADSPPDTAPLDTAPTPDTSTTPPSCNALFVGKVPGYSLCNETTTSCRFYFSASQANCNNLCGSHPCLKTEDNEPGTTCDPETNMACGSGPCTCSSNLGDGICTCQR